MKTIASQKVAERSESHSGMWNIRRPEIKLGREIGRGTFGVVYEAEYFGAELAAKVIHGLSESSKDELMKESQLQKTLPNLGFFMDTVVVYSI